MAFRKLMCITSVALKDPMSRTFHVRTRNLSRGTRRKLHEFEFFRSLHRPCNTALASGLHAGIVDFKRLKLLPYAF